MKCMGLDRAQSLYLFRSITVILSCRCSSFLSIFTASVKAFYSNRCSNHQLIGVLVFVFTSTLFLDLFCQFMFSILS